MVITSSSSTPFILVLLFLLSPSYCSPTSSSTGLILVEEKARLGSMPPSCENRCNMCHPCMAVQVPATPSRRRVDPSSLRSSSDNEINRYSNYKPLGWKCRCQAHLYNP